MKTRLKELRKRSGKTQKEIAEIFSMQPTVYRRYETGERNMTLDIALCIAEYYNVSIDYLIEREKTTEENNLTQQETLLLRYWKLLSIKQQNRIIDEISDYIELDTKS